MSERVKGATSVSLLFRLTDSTTGAAKSGVDVTTLKLQYERPGAAASTATSLTLLAALTTAWTAYGAKEVDATNSKGVYRVDCPDAGFGAGSDEVTWSVSGTGIETASRLIDLMAFDARNALPSVTVGAYAGGEDPATLLGTGTGLSALASASNMAEANADLDELIATVGAGVTVGGYATGQDPAALLLAAVVDGGFTLKQMLALSAAVLAGDFTVVRDSVGKTLTVTYYRPANPGTTATVMAVLVTSYSDAALTLPVSRAVTFSNLP